MSTSSPLKRLALLAGGLVLVAAVTVVVAAGGGSAKTVSAATVVVRHAKPLGGVKTIRFRKGAPIDLTVRSDTADEVHFHGYNIGKDVRRGGSVRFRMPATIVGTFEVELEKRNQQLALVEVLP